LQVALVDMKFVFWATELQVSMSFSHLMYHWLESALYLKFTIYRKFSMYHSLCQMLTFPQICLCFFSVAFMWMIFISFPEFIVLFYGCISLIGTSLAIPETQKSLIILKYNYTLLFSTVIGCKECKDIPATFTFF
jgi:hypothetical protein